MLKALANLPPLLTYLFLGAGAATENIAPPVPADTFVLFGAFLSAMGRANVWIVWLVTWPANVASALMVYGLSRRYGSAFFGTRIGRLLLHPGQLESVARFYRQWGAVAIFLSRFLPGFRAVVPVFAGVTHVPVLRAGLPIFIASGIWYGFIVFVGHQAGRNWGAIEGAFARYASWLLWVAVPLAVLVVVWWWRTRRHAPGPH